MKIGEHITEFKVSLSEPKDIYATNDPEKISGALNSALGFLKRNPLCRETCKATLAGEDVLAIDVKGFLFTFIIRNENIHILTAVPV